jgi:hypothetical protein
VIPGGFVSGRGYQHITPYEDAIDAPATIAAERHPDGDDVERQGASPGGGPPVGEPKAIAWEGAVPPSAPGSPRFLSATQSGEQALEFGSEIHFCALWPSTVSSSRRAAQIWGRAAQG